MLTAIMPHMHDWRRWDSFGDYGWKCAICGCTAQDDPTSDSRKVTDAP